jgi:hypothetical protein
LLDRTKLDEIVGTLQDLANSVERLPGGEVLLSTQRDPKRTVITALDRLRDAPDTHVIVRGSSEVHGWWNGRRLLLTVPSRNGWNASVWKNLMVGIAGFGGARPWPAPTHSEQVTSCAEAWARFG